MRPSSALPTPGPEGSRPQARWRAWNRAPLAPAVIYLNFSDGTESFARGDTDNPALNVSAIGEVAPYPAFAWPDIGNGRKSRTDIIRAVARLVHDAYLPYNALITTSRPASPPYTMVVIGGHPALFGYSSKVAGLALMDCDNLHESNVVFVFPESLKGSLQALFVTVAQEAAHALGLEHTVNPTDIMYPRLDPAQQGFPDNTSHIAGERLCGNVSQNTHARLLELVGAWPGGEKPLEDGSRGDSIGPTISFEEPLPGATVVQPFTLRLSAHDESGVAELVIAAGSADKATARQAPFAWSLSGFDSGPLTIAVTAHDGAGNVGRASLAITVARQPGGGGAGCSLAAARPGQPGRDASLPSLPALPALPALFALFALFASWGRGGRARL